MQCRKYHTAMMLMIDTLDVRLLAVYSHPAGLEILQKHKVFDFLGPMSVMPGRDDLCHLIMTSLDYNVYV
jgi:hypothetical protein